MMLSSCSILPSVSSSSCMEDTGVKLVINFGIRLGEAVLELCLMREV